VLVNELFPMRTEAKQNRLSDVTLLLGRTNDALRTNDLLGERAVALNR
jgi:hypothetical protein